MGLAHFVKDYRRAVLGSDLELTADMVHYELPHEFVVLVLNEVVIAYTRADKHSFDALDLAYLPQHIKVLRVIYFKSRTGIRSKAFLAHAQSL